MDRRSFIKWGGLGLAGAAAGSTGLSSLFGGAAFADEPSGTPWKFGVMADTQWKRNLDGKNPGTVAVGIIERLNAEFIRHGVQFVIQVGDLVDVENDALNGHPEVRTMPFRAAAAQALYDAGIGFFPLRGNHEASGTAALEFQDLYPQARGFGERAGDATAFSSPFPTLDGLSYSFDAGGVRFVLLDQFTRTDGTSYLGSTNNNIVDQLPWIERQLAGRPAGGHALVFSHKNLIGQNHTDCLFGADPTANAGARNAFIRALQENGVRYVLGGHDHMHDRSIVTSPDGAASVGQLICASNSYKFYVPSRPSRDETYDFPPRERNVAQELFTIGYYIFTVDGPRVTVDYHSASHGLDFDDVDLASTPAGVAFFNRETWGYSLNGRAFVIAQGEPYSTVRDEFSGTSARILGGSHLGVETDRSLRSMSKTVNTGWSVPTTPAASSHVLHLWGTANSLALWDGALTGLLPAADRSVVSDPFVLSMSYFEESAIPTLLGSGGFGLAARRPDGSWVNAVDLNQGGSKRFILGPWREGLALGTHGVDPSTKTAWAVLDHDGEFVVRRGIDVAPGLR